MIHPPDLTSAFPLDNKRLTIYLWKAIT